jgi:hypothetical protein
MNERRRTRSSNLVAEADLRKRDTRGFFETATAAIVRKHLRFTPEDFSVMSSTTSKNLRRTCAFRNRLSLIDRLLTLFTPSDGSHFHSGPKTIDTPKVQRTMDLDLESI